MIEAMRQRGFSDRTHTSYLAAVTDLARFYRKSPDELDTDKLQVYFNHLAQERELSAATCRLYLNAVRFLYLQVLKWSSFDVPLVVPKKPQRIPELLTREEVGRIVHACANPKHRMLLELCYGCGLRVSEVVKIRVRHIDGERRLLRIEQGKGAKDRLVIIAPSLLDKLRCYWSRYHPTDWLFPNGNDPTRHLSITTAQKVFGRAKEKSEIDKVGGIHGLRHAYATHQLEQGLPVHQLQRLLGHGNLQTTMRYLHWVPSQQREGRDHADLIASLETHHE
jgi:site-specific recombinase XerD